MTVAKQRGQHSAEQVLLTNHELLEMRLEQLEFFLQGHGVPLNLKAGHCSQAFSEAPTRKGFD
jgi:hypothetical protein